MSAHGTGAAIPPVDEQVVRMRLITPAMGALELSAAQNPSLFRAAKVGLGLLGVVSELTLQCVDALELMEETVVTSVEVCHLAPCLAAAGGAQISSSTGDQVQASENNE